MSGPTAKTDEAVVLADQQPIQRVVGKRVTAPPGVVPNARARAAMSANARYLTKVPKGIFFYQSHQEMIAIANAGRSTRCWPGKLNVAEYTRPATWDDVKQLARLLNEAGVEYALVDGYAIAAHGFNRFSEDIDILVNPVAENSRRWIRALSQLPDHATRETELAADAHPHRDSRSGRRACSAPEPRRPVAHETRGAAQGSDGRSTPQAGHC
jgi:hypothetical protein